MLARLPVWAKWIGGGLGTIIVGAIGSGVWERLGDPLYVFARDGLLNLATLGLVTLKDSLYADIALGLHEGASTQLLTYVLFAMGYGTFLGTLLVTRRFRRAFTKLSELADDARRDETESKSKASFDDLYKSTKTSAQTMKWQLYYVVWPLTAVLVVIAGFSAVRTSYTGRAIAHYKQLTALVAPFASEAQIKSFDSRFAQIRSASDYVGLTSELATIATQHNLRLPDFQPW